MGKIKNRRKCTVKTETVPSAQELAHKLLACSLRKQKAITWLDKIFAFIDRVSKNHLRLLGVDTPESLEQRKVLFEKSKKIGEKGEIIFSLIGNNSPESMELRKKFGKKDPTLKPMIAISLAGVNTPEAMEMRKQLLTEMSDTPISKKRITDFLQASLVGVEITDEVSEFKKLLNQQ